MELCMALSKKTCRIKTLKMRGILLTTLETKVLQYVIMKNTSIMTMDFSGCIDENLSNFEIFLKKIDEFSKIRFLTLDNMEPSMTNSIKAFGAALGRNKEIEVLNMRGNRIKVSQYCSFWEELIPNKSLKKLNVSKTDLSDRVVGALSTFLES
jgi:hypothetical protein